MSVINPNITGFEAYWTYVTVKKLYFEGSYDIRKGLPRKQMFLQKWNQSRVNRDGVFFLKINEKVPQLHELIYLYSFYYWENPDFYVTDIIDDNFRTYVKYRKELKDWRRSFESQWLTIVLHCKENKIRIVDLLTSRDKSQCPDILKMNLSPLTLIVLNHVFNFVENIDMKALNILDRERMKRKLSVINKMTNLFKSRLEKENWKEVIEQ